MSDPISINNNQHSWGSITAKVDGIVFYGFTAISYGDSRTRTKAYGMGKHHAPRGRSRGKYEIDNAKVTGWTSSVQALREELGARATGGLSYGDVEFQFTVDYFESDEIPVLVTLNRCVWAKNSTSNDESPDSMKEEIELDVMSITRNEMVLFDQSRAQIA